MAKANWGAGGAGAATGAATGAALGSIIPGPGTAIGAGIGGLVGGIGGLLSKKPKKPTDPMAGQRSELLASLLERIGQGMDAPLDSAFFRSGSADLMRQLGDQSKVDYARAAATGGAGGEFELAQAAGRQQQLGRSMTGLMGAAGQHALSQEQMLLGSAGGLMGQGTGSALQLAQMEQAERARRSEQLSSAISNTILANHFAQGGQLPGQHYGKKKGGYRAAPGDVNPNVTPMYEGTLT